MIYWKQWCRQSSHRVPIRPSSPAGPSNSLPIGFRVRFATTLSEGHPVGIDIGIRIGTQLDYVKQVQKVSLPSGPTGYPISRMAYYF